MEGWWDWLLLAPMRGKMLLVHPCPGSRGMRAHGVRPRAAFGRCTGGKMVDPPPFLELQANPGPDDVLIVKAPGLNNVIIVL